MSDVPRSVEAFRSQADRYDRDAELLMGNRLRQRQYLADLLGWIPEAPNTFLDLACGTGYLTEVFFEVFPEIRGVAIDGSEPMLEQARARFNGTGRDLTLRCELLQAIDWSTVGATPLVFSSFAIHHLPDTDKRELIGRIFEHLDPGGLFILFDSFRPDDPRADELIEHLTVVEIQRRVRETKGTAPAHDHIITRDREVKAAEGDQEASFETVLQWLRDAGFESVTPIFLDLRLGGIVAVKPGAP